MNKITFYRYPMCIIARGHVEPLPGEEFNLLCCAVSALMQGIVAALEGFGISYDLQQGDGVYAVTALPAFLEGGTVRIMFEAFAAALSSLAADSGGRVQFEEAELCGPDS